MTVVGNAESPRTAIAWLRAGPGRDLLVAMAHGLLPLTHDTLDERAGQLRGRANAVEHLRQLLVTSGALLSRDEHFSRLERTLAALLNAAHPNDAKTLRRSHTSKCSRQCAGNHRQMVPTRRRQLDHLRRSVAVPDQAPRSPMATPPDHLAGDTPSGNLKRRVQRNGCNAAKWLHMTDPAVPAGSLR